MYDLRRLRQVARDGLTDLVPALRRAFNDDPHDDRLHLVYGDQPRRNILLAVVIGVLGGELLARAVPQLTVGGLVNPAAVLLGAFHAALVRRYLFRTDAAVAQDFPWLAASVAPAAGALMLASLGRDLLAFVSMLANESLVAQADHVVRSFARALGTAAGLVIAVATLCYRRNWLSALRDLAARLIAFRITIWIMVLLFVEIGIVGPIVSALVEAATGWHPPGWIGDVMDLVTYAALMTSVLLAVIGATWTVCRDNFSVLLAQGEVDVLHQVVERAESDKQRERREEKARRAQEKRARRRRGKRDRAQPAQTIDGKENGP